MPNNAYDVIVVGSGMTGAGGEELARRLNTLVLEAGRPSIPIRITLARTVLGSPFPRTGHRNGKPRTSPFNVLLCLRRVASKFFVNDKENPYTQRIPTAVLLIRGRQVGGPLEFMWGRQTYR